MDLFRLGVTIAVGKTTDQVCIIKAILPYLAIRGSREASLYFGSHLAASCRFSDLLMRYAGSRQQLAYTQPCTRATVFT